MRKFTLFLSLLFATAMTAFAQNFADGVYEIKNADASGSRGYFVYSTEYPTTAQLAGVELGGYESKHYAYGDPKTNSYQDFLPPSYNISGEEERFKEIFRKRKDAYRRQRDLSIFCFIGVYLLSIIDAYVDAELSDFDITKVDVDMRSSKSTIAVCRNGSGVEFSEDEAKTILTEDEIEIYIELNQGEVSATAWGCDLTYDYVKINGDYRS
mgnify:CR=1 FL=1